MTDVQPTDPFPRPLRLGLRAAALHLKSHRARGHVAPTVWAGTPGMEHDSTLTASFATAASGDADGLDAAARLEVAVALAHVVLPTVPEPHFWVTRSGEPELWTGDHAWVRAVWTACAELRIPTSFTLVTRTGWTHVPSGVSHRWKRLRA